MLRSIRYGEADRILHLYTPGYGRLAAIAKGARRARSRFGARLEPFFHIRVILHEGRGELHTVTAWTRSPPTPACATTPPRSMPPRAPATRWRGCSRPPSPHPEVFRLLANELALLDLGAVHARPATGLAFRLKLLLAAGHRAPARRPAPGAASPSICRAFPPPPAGSCAARARRPRSRSARSPTTSWSAALGRPLAQAPDASDLRAGPGGARDHRDRRAPRPRAAAPAVGRTAVAPQALDPPPQPLHRRRRRP